MLFNPFADIYNMRRELRSSVSEKIKDTFFVCWGDPFEIDTQPRLGLFDYFTFGIFALNLYVWRAIFLEQPIVLVFILSPILAINGILCIMDVLSRFLVSSILTLISIPLVVLVHIISNELKRWDVKKEVNAKIQACLDLGSNSLIIGNISLHLREWTETRTNYLIDQLNNNSTITKLTINYSLPDAGLLVQLGLKLKHVTDLSIPYMLCREEEKKIHVAPIKNLFKFLIENTTIDSLKVRGVLIDDNSLEEFNQLIARKETKRCKLSTFSLLNNKRSSERINNSLETNCLLNSWHEFYKIMSTLWSVIRDDYGQININNDVIKLILMSYSEDTLEQIKQQITRPRFFSQQSRVVDLDSQNETPSNHMNNEI